MGLSLFFEGLGGSVASEIGRETNLTDDWRIDFGGTRGVAALVIAARFIASTCCLVGGKDRRTRTRKTFATG